MKAQTKDMTEGLSVKTLSFTAWAFPLLVLVVVAVASLLVLIPQTQQLMDEREEVERREEKLKQLEKKRAFLDGLNEDQLADQLAVVTRTLPNDKPVFTFLSSLVGLLEEEELEGLNIDGYDFKPGEIASDSAENEPLEIEAKEGGNISGELQLLPIEIGFSGDQSLILTLMERIEGMAPLADVQGFKLSGKLNQEEPEGEQKTIEMQLNLYYSYIPEKISKPEQPLTQMSKEDQSVIEKLRSQRMYEGIDANLTEVYLSQEREDIFNY